MNIWILINLWVDTFFICERLDDSAIEFRFWKPKVNLFQSSIFTLYSMLNGQLNYNAADSNVTKMTLNFIASA